MNTRTRIRSHRSPTSPIAPGIPADPTTPAGPTALDADTGPIAPTGLSTPAGPAAIPASAGGHGIPTGLSTPAGPATPTRTGGPGTPTRTDPETPTPGLELRGIDKSFGSHRILSGLDLTARPGRVYALLGPNGAGKSTALSIALGLHRPDAGVVLVDGRPWTREALGRIGASINGPALFPHLDARRNLLVHAHLTGTDPSAIDPLLDAVGLSGAGRTRARRMSTGMKMRLALAIALLADPDILLLDEPQNGLDPQGVIDLREMLIDLARDGRTVVVSSHQLGEMVRMADDVGVLAHGRLVHEGPLSDLADPDDAVGLEEAYLALTSGPAPTRGESVGASSSRSQGSTPEPTTGESDERGEAK
ncbi:ATP-binding cassette domain-containing protein [Actinomyces sp. B33]|uniref:ABC transporter ATP-binding protein n=1 Tax=Actinomyces sp. B33 TaxID=2942131 RepID=UPI002340964B|nr:ATP-binding cassette domain-containing protein [Actinomyces sp. B33]MDC4232400.1 ATP-binding cassette domain-containing protein [Actinomyces sp. B33]